MLNAIATMGTYLLTGVEYALDKTGIGKIVTMASLLCTTKQGFPTDHPAPIPINALPVEYIGIQTSKDDFLRMKNTCHAFLQQYPKITYRHLPNEYDTLHSYCITTLGFLFNQKNSLELRKEAASALLPFFRRLSIGDHGIPAGEFVEAALSNKGIDFFADLAKVDLNLTLRFLKDVTTMEEEEKINFIASHFSLNPFDAKDFFYSFGRSEGTPMHQLITQPVGTKILSQILAQSIPDFLQQEGENLLNRVQKAKRMPPEVKQRRVNFLLQTAERICPETKQGLVDFLLSQ